MSRIGKQPILILDKVEAKMDQNEIKVKGPKGELVQTIDPLIEVEIRDKEIVLKPAKKRKDAAALWGLYRALIANMVLGVTEGFEKQLEIEGVGFRAAMQGKKLVLNIGLSHPVEIEPPSSIEFKVDKNTITISGIDKQLVGLWAAKIRANKKPEPYKGKGIRYSDEVVRRKAGKKAVGTE